MDNTLRLTSWIVVAGSLLVLFRTLFLTVLPGMEMPAVDSSSIAGSAVLASSLEAPCASHAAAAKPPVGSDSAAVAKSPGPGGVTAAKVTKCPESQSLASADTPPLPSGKQP